MGASLPTRERGLKSYAHFAALTYWASLPTRERGLKSLVPISQSTDTPVAPHAGAWIEIGDRAADYYNPRGRSPRGSVD